jgi:transposase
MPARRYELTDAEWNQIKDFFPPKPEGVRGRPPKEARVVFNGIVWIARSGAPWRDLPERYGSWQTIYDRFCTLRDSGLLEEIFLALNEDADFENLSVDSTTVRAHQHSAGAKKGL